MSWGLHVPSRIHGIWKRAGSCEDDPDDDILQPYWLEPQRRILYCRLRKLCSMALCFGHSLYIVAYLILHTRAAQPVHHAHEAVTVTVNSQGRPAALLRSESATESGLRPKPRLATCSGYRLECTPKGTANPNVDPCKGTDCNAHHACMGAGFQNCMIKLTGPAGQGFVLLRAPSKQLTSIDVWVRL